MAGQLNPGHPPLVQTSGRYMGYHGNSVGFGQSHIKALYGSGFGNCRKNSTPNPANSGIVMCIHNEKTLKSPV